MSVLDLVYISERSAIQAGMTHEGRLFGVPAWLVETGVNEVSGCPKVPLLQLWCIAVDWLMDQALWLIDADVSVEAPITLGRRIVPKEHQHG